MRTCLFLVAAAAMTAAAQSSATTWTTDISGNRMAASTLVSDKGVATDLRQSINGKEVPLEQTEVKVLSKSGDTTVTERIVRHYGAGGELVATERVVKEETATPDGSSVRATTYRSDLNGNFVEAERSTIDTRKIGPVVITESAVEKKDLNGSFAITEKRSASVEPTSDGSRSNETVYQRDSNGSLHEAQRLATVEKKTGNQTVTSTAVYEPGLSGEMTLAKQNIVKTVVAKDGSSSEEIESYGRTSDGHVREAGAGPSLTEKRVIERHLGAGGAVIETQTVQVPSVNDPGRLDPAHKVSETICRGACEKK